MNGVIDILPNGYWSYEIFDAEESFVFELATVLINQFGYQAALPLNHLASTQFDLYKKQTKLTIGWDHWSGCFVMAHCEMGNQEILRIKDTLEQRQK